PQIEPASFPANNPAARQLATAETIKANTELKKQAATNSLEAQAEADKKRATMQAEQEFSSKLAEPLKKQTNTLISDDVHKALDILAESRKGGITPATGTIGSLLKGMSETNSGRLEDRLKTIRANIKLDKLKAMRDSSPTGSSGM